MDKENMKQEIEKKTKWKSESSRNGKGKRRINRKREIR